MVISRGKLALIGIATLAALTVASPAFAQATQGGGMFADIQQRYANAARGWSNAMTNAATFLFMGLATISLVWTMGLLALKKADLGEFFSEFIRFVIFTGFYLFLLRNGTAIADAIIKSLQQLGQNASSIGAVTPGSIVDIGFEIVSTTIDQSSFWEPVDSAVGILIACVILVVLALVAVNMLLLLISAWILAFGGIFFLGFGGARWTSDMAINYFKTVLGVAASLMAMVLLVGIGKSFIDDFHTSMTAGDPSLKELAATMVASVILLALVNKIPGLVAGIITGASVGGAANVGSFGAGAAMTAGGMAAAAAAMGGAAMAAGAANAAGGASAIQNAFKAAQSNMASGSGAFSGGGSSSSGGGGGSSAGSLGPDGGGGGGGGSRGGGSALAGAMGNAGGGGGGGGGSAGGANDNGGGGSDAASASGGDGATAGAGSPAGSPGGGVAGAVGEPDGAAPGSAEEVVAATAEAGSVAQATSGQGGSSGASGGAGGGDAGGGGRSAAATAALFAADMAGNLGGGIGRTIAAKAGGLKDAAMARANNSLAGQIAAEIANPGTAAAKRDAAAGRPPEPLTPAKGPDTASSSQQSAPFGGGGSDGGALDGDGGASEAIGADAGGFGGDTISGSKRGANPSAKVDASTEVSEFVNKGAAQ